MIAATVTVVLDTRRVLASGLFRVKIRITHNRKSYYISTMFDLSEEQWQKVSSNYARDRNKWIRNQIDAEAEKIRGIISSMDRFDFDQIKSVYTSGGSSEISFIQYSENLIKEMNDAGRIRYAQSIRCALNKWKWHDIKVNWSRIDVNWLERFEQKCKVDGLTTTTIGIYLRTLRRIINDGIEAGYYPQGKYPFGRRRFQIPASANPKRAMTEEELRALWKHQPILKSQQYAKDLFFFSYFCQGMNLANILRLKKTYIKDDNIIFTRKKTDRTRKAKSKPVVVPISKEISDIINNYKTSSDYLFPGLEKGMTEGEKVTRIQTRSRNISKALKEINNQLELPKFTFVSARHSWATRMKNAGVPIKYISEGLGHSNQITTESYLSSFDNEKAREFNKRATDFLKSS